ncbi:MAG: RDD family protein [Solirubrobacterales bacterium]|nr:RDD family protein [Solirubrobacterales bacterium]
MSAEESSFSWGADTFARSGARVPRSRDSGHSSLMGARMAAVLIDGVVVLVPALAIAYLLSLAFPHHGLFISDSGAAPRSSPGVHFVLPAPALLLITALSLGYFFVCEAVWEQTLGKRVMHLRVRSAAGAAAGLNAISARTVLRLIDGLGFYLVGFLIALLTGRRLGDWAGRTVVVRDEDAFSAPRREAWRVALYPASWLVAVLVAVFALGMGAAVGESEQAIALVRGYVAAREGGDAVLACSMLTKAQQQELVAIEGGSYAEAAASRCPEYILRSDPASHLLNPGLAALGDSTLRARYSPLGALAVYSPQDPGLELIAIPENGRMRLDMRGFEKVEFVSGCTNAGRLTAGECACTFDTARAEAPFPDRGLTSGDRSLLLEDALACRRRPAGTRAAIR